MAIAETIADEDYRHFVLERINHNHHFLRNLVVLNGVKLPGDRNPESLCGEELVGLINSQLPNPSEKHREAMQALWIDVHKYLMGVDRGREVSDSESYLDFMFNESGGLKEIDRFNLFYVVTYIQPAILEGKTLNGYEKTAQRRVKEADELLEGLFEQFK